jgi:hypothetical protein
MVNLGSPNTKKLTTGRLFIQLTSPSVDTFYRDMGNCTEHKIDPKVTRKEHKKAAGGFLRTDISLVSEISPMYQFIFDEHTPDLISLALLGTQGADSVQAGAVIVAEQLTNNSQQGRTYFTTQPGCSAVTVKVGGIAMVLNVDYAIDLGSGAVTILNGGGIANASTVTINYTSAALTYHNFTAFQTLLLQGSVKYVETDQFNIAPRQTTTFNGQLYVTQWGDNKADYNNITVDAVPLTNPVVQTRQD